MASPSKPTSADMARTARRNSLANAAVRVDQYLRKVWRPVRSRRVYTETNSSKTSKYRLLIGYDKKGRPVKPSFGESKNTAVIFQEKWNAALDNNNTTELKILDDVSQIDVRWALTECEKANTTLREVVNFYLLHALPEGGFLNWEEAIDKYFEIQKEKNLSDASASKKHKNYRTFYKPLKDFYGKKKLTETTLEDVKKYTDKRGKNWSPRTFNDHVSYGERLWNVLAEQKYCSTELNPFAQTPRRRKKIARGNRKIMRPDEVNSYFQFAYRQAQKHNTQYQELALLTLTFFCGVRTTEASRCDWDQIKKNHKAKNKDETNWTITVWGDQEKTFSAKVNPIPTNAKYWLDICYKNRDKSRKKIVSDNWQDRMKKLRNAFKKEMLKEYKWKLDVPANTGRHCFCSYHLGLYDNYQLTQQRMKHGNVSTLKSNYEAVVNPSEAKRFFEIFPKDIWERRMQEKLGDELTYWGTRGLNKNYEQISYYKRFAAAGEKAFVKHMVKLGVPEIEADEAIQNTVPVKVKGALYKYDESLIFMHFVNVIQANGFQSEHHRPKGQPMIKDHLKIFTAAFFEIEDIADYI